jgi:peptidoglycan/LPS O-acetylase OafA/YrhL
MHAKHEHYRLGYRPDVEGMRAIAILLVVAAHAKVPWLAGGFVGVDVFYVLSGYLITGLLVQESVTTGRLRFANFYGRRLRRLLPALFLMLAVTCGLAYLLMPPSGIPGQVAAASSAALWLSNFHFALWNMDYFAPAAATNLYLHTWSLGVEEQFYLVWPLLVVVAVGAYRWTRRAVTLKYLKWLFAGICIVGFTVSLLLTYRAPHFAFYMMPTRAWQFAIGALVFLVVGSPTFRIEGALLRWRSLQHLGWVGLAMIIGTAVIINDNVPYPGSWSLVPTTGTALVLIAGGYGVTHGVARCLSVRPLQAIGKLSYSWYLWHWPVLILGATLVDMRNWWNVLALVAVSFAISAVSYHYFETPIRHNRKLLARPRLAVCATLVLIISVGGLLRYMGLADAAKPPNNTLARIEAARNDAPLPNRIGCHAEMDETIAKVCSFGNADAPHTAVLTGDSMALEWFPAARQAFDHPGWRFVSITKSGCPMVLEPFFDARRGREYTECTIWRQNAIRKIRSLHPDIVLVSSFTDYPFDKAQWISGTQRLLARLSDAVGNIVIIRPSPLLPVDGPSCLEPRGKLYRILVSTSHCESSAYTKRSNRIYAWLRTATLETHNATVIDLTQAVCPHGICHARLQGQIVFRDSHHMTSSFARTLAPALTQAVEPFVAKAQVTYPTANAGVQPR